ncbi:DUF4352 domain-containing protein [Anaerosporobacter faecicola]|uniref:DUF4352 domain-containing protein n=1 Tax=Anaerosporobacter faecicola TaxID=2718714 RepID=UPI001438A504|nr:DUF4352 domain-containing protein [Anaerosporobacter faecicola]
MKKKFILLTLVSVSMLLLSACASTKTLKEDNNAIIAQYIAGSVLKFDTNYEDGLLYEYQRPVASTDSKKEDTTTVSEENKEEPKKEDSKQEETKEPVKETTPSPEASTAEEAVTYCSLSDVYQKKDLKVTYKNYSTEASYTGNYSEAAFSVEPQAGNQLLILNMSLKNMSSKKMKISFIRSGISYELNIGEETYYPILTVISNDIQYLSTTIKEGKTKQAVLIFEIPKKTKVQNATLTVTNKEQVSQVTIK